MRACSDETVDVLGPLDELGTLPEEVYGPCGHMVRGKRRPGVDAAEAARYCVEVVRDVLRW